MEIKIIKSKNLKEFESLVNEFFFLVDWYNRIILYFKTEKKIRKNIATIITTKKDLDIAIIGKKTLQQKKRLEEDPELKERLFNAIQKLYPKRNLNW